METGPPAPPPRPGRPRPKMAPGPPRGALANGVAAAAGQGAAANQGEGEPPRPGEAANGGAAGRRGSKVAAGSAGVTEGSAGVTEGSAPPPEGLTGVGAAAANEDTETRPGVSAAILRPAEAGGMAAAANEEPEAGGRSAAANEGAAAAKAGSTAANEEPEPHATSAAAILGPTPPSTAPQAPAVATAAILEPASAILEPASAILEPASAPSAILEPASAILEPLSAILEPASAPSAILEPASAILEPASAILEPASAILEPASAPSAILEPASAILEPASASSAILEPASAILEPASAPSAVLEPASAILEPASAILEPASAILEPASAILEPASAAVSGSPGERSLAGANGPGRGSQGSLGPGIPAPRGGPGGDLDSVSLLSGTLESLAGPFPDDVSSMGSDSEVAGPSFRRTDRYGFLGGSQYCETPENSVPVDVARQRELKWLEMFNHWDKWLSRRYQKVKLRCRKGIPSSLRARAWQLLSDSKAQLDHNPGLFQELERQPGEPRWLDAIEKDLHRQFPFHEMFAARGGHGQQDLYRILKAYTVYRPQEGYCQAQAPVAAVLLMHMPAEQAFWCLVQICEKYLPGYYSAGLEAVQLDGEVFGALLRRAAPAAHRHLRRFRVEPVLYLTEWFMCIFARSLPWAAVLRVWDMFFCEGVKIMFRVGLVLLRQALGTPEKLRSCQGMYETMERLRSVPPPGLHEDSLVQQVTAVPVTEALLERERGAQLRRWRETRGELQRPPPPPATGPGLCCSSGSAGGAPPGRGGAGTGTPRPPPPKPPRRGEGGPRGGRGRQRRAGEGGGGCWGGTACGWGEGRGGRGRGGGGTSPPRPPPRGSGTPPACRTPTSEGRGRGGGGGE